MPVIHPASTHAYIPDQTPTRISNPVADARLLQHDCSTRLQDVLERMQTPLTPAQLDRIETEILAIREHLGMPPLPQPVDATASQPATAEKPASMLGGTRDESVVNSQVTDSIT